MEQNLLFQEYEEVKPLLTPMGELIGFSQRIIMTKKKAEEIYGKKIVKKGITNQRQSIIKEIQDIIELENGGKINAKVLAMKLSHCDLETLYFMKSEGLDYRKRTGKPFSAYIYGSIKPKK